MWPRQASSRCRESHLISLTFPSKSQCRLHRIPAHHRASSSTSPEQVTPLVSTNAKPLLRILHEMRSIHTVLFLLLRISTHATTEEFSPFTPALLTLPNATSHDAPQSSTSLTLLTNDLELRALPLSPRDPIPQNPCASSYSQCPGAPSLCCPSNSQCLPDAQGMVGCCPHGAACTGVVSQQSSASTSSVSAGVGAGAAGGGVITTTTTSAPAQGGGQASVLGGSLSATGSEGGATIFAAAAQKRVHIDGDTSIACAGLAFGVAMGGLLML